MFPLQTAWKTVPITSKGPVQREARQAGSTQWPGFKEKYHSIWVRSCHGENKLNLRVNPTHKNLSSVSTLCTKATAHWRLDIALSHASSISKVLSPWHKATCSGRWLVHLFLTAGEASFSVAEKCISNPQVLLPPAMVNARRESYPLRLTAKSLGWVGMTRLLWSSLMLCNKLMASLFLLTHKKDCDYNASCHIPWTFTKRKSIFDLDYSVSLTGLPPLDPTHTEADLCVQYWETQLPKMTPVSLFSFTNRSSVYLSLHPAIQDLS